MRSLIFKPQEVKKDGIVYDINGDAHDMFRTPEVIVLLRALKDRGVDIELTVHIDEDTNEFAYFEYEECDCVKDLHYEVCAVKFTGDNEEGRPTFLTMYKTMIGRYPIHTVGFDNMEKGELYDMYFVKFSSNISVFVAKHRGELAPSLLDGLFVSE